MRLLSRTVGGFLYDSLIYDKRGLITSANGRGLSATIGYNGLGAVVEADDHVGIGPSAEEFTVDALGNRLKRRNVGLKDSWHPDKNGVRLMTYDGNARITAINDTIQNSDFLLSEAYAYDGAGVLTLQHSRELDGIAQTNIYDQTLSYPAVDEKISNRPAEGGARKDSSRESPRGWRGADLVRYRC